MVKGWKWQLAGIWLTAVTVVSLAFGLIGYATRSPIFDDGGFVGYRSGLDNAVVVFWTTFLVLVVISIIGAIMYGLFRWAMSLGWSK